MLCGYLDNAATTQLCDAAKSAMTDAFDCFGNPSSLHKLGTESAEIIENAREDIANFIKADSGEIFFTSGGTEADNLAVFGAAQALRRRGNRIVTTAFEHSAIEHSMKRLEEMGFEVIYLKPDSSGTVPIEAFEQAIDDKTILVSSMSVNNETGAILPVERLKDAVVRADAPALIHCDATQSFGKYAIYPERCGIDLMTMSAHKIHGPKGVGALYIRKGARILPHTYGGEQQNGVRPGTEPLILIAGFAAALRDIGDMKANADSVGEVKRYLIRRVSELSDICINSPENSSDYILNFSVLGYKSETMLHFLEQRGVYVSSGSACAKGKQSHVLSALGLDKRRSDSALRVSLSKYSAREDIDMLIDGIKAAQATLIKAKN